MKDRPVILFTRVLPSYRIPVLERLNERLNGRLVVCAGRPPDSSSIRTLAGDDSGHLNRINARNYWFRGETLHYQPFRSILKQVGRPAAILAEESPRSLSLPLLMRCAHRHEIGLALWGHFSSNDRPFSLQNRADRYRIGLARRADACICYTDDIKEILKPYVPEERLFVARNTLDTDTLFSLYDRLAAEGKPAVRRRLGLPDKAPVIIFIGRLLRSKGTKMLLEVFARLRNSVPAHLLVIGDGPDRTRMEQWVSDRNVSTVHFTGSIKDWEASAPYLFASDLMLMPGYLGLAVNHAFAFGLPVVSQEPPPGGTRYHSPEVAYVRPGENGMLSEFGNVTAMVEAVQHILMNQDRFSTSAFRYAREHLTLDRMVDGLEAAVHFLEKT